MIPIVTLKTELAHCSGKSRPTDRGPSVLQETGFVLHMQYLSIFSTKLIFILLHNLCLHVAVANNPRTLGKWNYDNVRSASDYLFIIKKNTVI